MFVCYHIITAAVQAKHIRKVGLSVLLHRIVMKVSRDLIRKLNKTEIHDSNCGKLRTKKSRFVLKIKVFFSAIVKGVVGVDCWCWLLTASVVHVNSSISFVCFYILD